MNFFDGKAAPILYSVALYEPAHSPNQHILHRYFISNSGYRLWNLTANSHVCTSTSVTKRQIFNVGVIYACPAAYSIFLQFIQLAFCRTFRSNSQSQRDNYEIICILGIVESYGQAAAVAGKSPVQAQETITSSHYLIKYEYLQYF